MASLEWKNVKVASRAYRLAKQSGNQELIKSTKSVLDQARARHQAVVGKTEKPYSKAKGKPRNPKSFPPFDK